MRTFALALLLAPTSAFALDYDEAVSGDIPGHEGAPTLLGELSPGLNTVRGTVDPIQDSFTFTLPPGMEISSATWVVRNYRSLGNDGFGRFFQPSPFAVFGQTMVTGDQTVTFPTADIAGIDPIGFTAASVGPSGATYAYELRLVVSSTCTGGTVIWDEAAQGDILSDENAPQAMGTLSGDTYVICGNVDPIQDSMTFELAPGVVIDAVDFDVTHYQSLGNDGYARLIAPNPFSVFDDIFFSTDGAYTLDPLSIGARNPWGITMASVGPSGALYDYKITISTHAGPQVGAPTPPVAGSRATFQASGFAPRDTIYLLGSLNPGSTPVPPCPGLVAGLRSPSVLGSGRADASGTFSTSLNLPATLAGRRVYVQAVDVTRCTITPVATYDL